MRTLRMTLGMAVSMGVLSLLANPQVAAVDPSAAGDGFCHEQSDFWGGGVYCCSETTDGEWSCRWVIEPTG